MTSEECEWGYCPQDEYDTYENKEVEYANFYPQGGKTIGSELESFVINSDGNVFVISSELGGNLWQGYVGFYDSWNEAEKNSISPLAHFVADSTTFSCAARLSDTSIVCGADKGTLECIRFHSGEMYPDVRVYYSLLGHDDVVSSVSVFSNASHMVSGSFDSTSRSWDIENGACTSTSNVGKGAILSVGTSPVDNNLYCMACRDGNVYLLDSRFSIGTQPSILKNDLMPTGVYPTALLWPAVTPDSIFAGYSDGSLARLDMKTSNSIQNGGGNDCYCRPHVGRIISIDCHPEKLNLLVTGSEDRNICVTNFDSRDRNRHVVLGHHAGFVRCVKWSSACKTIGRNCDSVYSAGWDGKLRSHYYSTDTEISNGVHTT